MSEAKIHPTAVIGADVEIGPGTEIGPYCIVEDHVRIGANNRFLANIYIGSHTTVGAGNQFFPFTTLGLIPQDLKFKNEVTELHIGDNNMVREHVTLHRGTTHGGGVTRIDSNNLIMVGGHVAHDCQVGNRSIISHGAALAGHVTVGDDAVVGAASSVHQFCRVGDHAFIGGHSVVVMDALPYVKTVGNHAKIYGINNIGLERKGFSKDDIEALRNSYRILFQKKLRLVDALEKLKETYADNARVKYLIDFIEQSERGITR